MPLASADDLKAYAEGAADETSPAFTELSGLMCWSAVIRCARNAGAITPLRAQMLETIDWKEDFSRFVSRSDMRVQNAAEMRQVPAGAFIAFIRVDPPDPYFRFVHDYRGKRHIVHAMLSLGGGRAAGNKNSYVGVGRPVGWEVLDLAGRLNWTGRRYDAINGYPRSARSELPLRIRYRELAEFQDDDPKGAIGARPPSGPPGGPGPPGPNPPGGPGPAGGPIIRTLQPNETTVAQPGEIWHVGPLADCVALAAVRPAHSLANGGVQSLFLWHVNGGLVQENTIPYRALTAFLGLYNADWIFVHGTNIQRTGREAFYRQSFDEELVDGNNSPTGHAVLHYRGPGLLIAWDGRILNQAELTAFVP